MPSLSWPSTLLFLLWHVHNNFQVPQWQTHGMPPWTDRHWIYFFYGQDFRHILYDDWNLENYARFVPWLPEARIFLTQTNDPSKALVTEMLSLMGALFALRTVVEARTFVKRPPEVYQKAFGAWKKFAERPSGKKRYARIEEAFLETFGLTAGHHLQSEPKLLDVKDTRFWSEGLLTIVKAFFAPSTALTSVGTPHKYFKSFASALITAWWRCQRTTWKTRKTRLDMWYKELMAQWNKWEKGSRSPNVPQITDWIELAMKFIDLANAYPLDPLIAERQVELQVALETIRKLAPHSGDSGYAIDPALRPKHSKALPLQLRKALVQLSTDMDIRQARMCIELHMVPPEDGHASSTGVISGHLGTRWADGTEPWSKWTELDFLNVLGLLHEGNKGLRIPGLAEWIYDGNGDCSPWSELQGMTQHEMQTYFQEHWTEYHDMHPLWHQLAGAYVMIEGIFSGRPMFLMDAVGLGKTLQCLTVIMILTYYTEYFMRNGQFPGIFAKRALPGIWRGEAIPPAHPKGPQPKARLTPGDRVRLHLPSETAEEGKNLLWRPPMEHSWLIICPVTLLPQWQQEISRFIQPGMVDVIPYLGNFISRQGFFQHQSMHGWHASRQPPFRRVLLASYSAIASDCQQVYGSGINLSALLNNLSSVMNPQNEANYANSVFGRRWAGVFSDEVHSCRNLNMNGKAVWILNRKSQAVVLASATMLYTSLQDLRNIGCIANHPAKPSPERSEGRG